MTLMWSCFFAWRKSARRIGLFKINFAPTPTPIENVNACKKSGIPLAICFPRNPDCGDICIKKSGSLVKTKSNVSIFWGIQVNTKSGTECIKKIWKSKLFHGDRAKICWISPFYTCRCWSLAESFQREIIAKLKPTSKSWMEHNRRTMRWSDSKMLIVQDPARQKGGKTRLCTLSLSYNNALKILCTIRLLAAYLVVRIDSICRQ